MFDVLAQNFFDPDSIKVFGGATAAVVAVSVTVRKVLGIHHAIVPFAAALLISVALALNEGTPTPLEWLFVFLNACLLFCAAIGANESVVDLNKERTIGSGKQQGKAAKSWFRSYFRH